MRNHKRVSSDDSEVDMTPMLDIVFIMLIFFIVTTSFVKEKGIIIERPSSQSSPIDDPKKPIIIDINESGEISLAGRIIELSAVRANIESARASNQNAVVLVRAHHAATTGVVVSAVDQSQLAGAVKVTVVKPVS